MAPPGNGLRRNAGGATLQTLNRLFPRGNYFTEAALLGPQNFFDAHRVSALNLPHRGWSISAPTSIGAKASTTGSTHRAVP
jgi:hypothetical protein